MTTESGSASDTLSRHQPRSADSRCAELIAEIKQGFYVENNKETLADFLDRWKARLGRHVSPKTRERYSELLRNHVRPHIGARRLQAIRVEALNRLYADLHQKLAPRTIKQSIVPARQSR